MYRKIFGNAGEISKKVFWRNMKFLELYFKLIDMEKCSKIRKNCRRSVSSGITMFERGRLTGWYELRWLILRSTIRLATNSEPLGDVIRIRWDRICRFPEICESGFQLIPRTLGFHHYFRNQISDEIVSDSAESGGIRSDPALGLNHLGIYVFDHYENKRKTEKEFS